MYVSPNYRSKADLKRALETGKRVDVFAPGIGLVPTDGDVYLEGPHHPEPHKWYAKGTMQGGKLIAVR